MPDPTSDSSHAIEHHRPVEYRVAEHPLQAVGFTVTPSADGERIEVRGECPSCAGRTVTTWDYGTGGGYKSPFWRRGRPARLMPTGPRTVCCDCGHAHADRPESAVFLGCGAYWQVELP